MLKAGSSTRIINNEIGTIIQAATSEIKAETVRDDLEANFLYLMNDDERVLFISCDVGNLVSSWMRKFREFVASNTGLPERNVIISCTHAHSGPCILGSNPLRDDLDGEWHERLRDWLLEGAREALANARECRVGYAKGHAEIAYNRRVCWSDGTHTMHGNVNKPGFTGIEGPRDSTHSILFVEDEDGNILGLIHSNSGHPVNFYSRNFYSADYPGLARKLLRDALGDIPVLYFNGGIGDNTPINLLKPTPGLRNPERNYRRQAYILAGETLRLISLAERHDSPVFKHVHEDMELPVRLPDENQVERDRIRVAEARANPAEKAGDRLQLAMAYGRMRLMEEFKDNPVDVAPIHALRIGGCAIATNPCELYGQFMIDLRRRSPAEVTLFADLTDAHCGYCPTMGAAMTGGYSGEAILWTRLGFEAGYRIVDTAAKLLHSLWRE